MGLSTVVYFPLSSPLVLIRNLRKSWFPEGAVFVNVFLRRNNGCDWVPFCFVFPCYLQLFNATKEVIGGRSFGEHRPRFCSALGVGFGQLVPGKR